MKWKRTGFLIGLTILLSGCSQYDDLIINHEEKEPLDLNKMKGIEFDIYCDVITSLTGKYDSVISTTRNSPEFTITPYVVAGDTAMYVVQYENGWKLYSASYNAPKVLFSSEEGSFDIDDKNMPPSLRNMIETTANKIIHISEDENNYDPSWSGFFKMSVV